ncbi:MAG: hypothetical protein AB4050_19910 [Synechococcus sp.]
MQTAACDIRTVETDSDRAAFLDVPARVYRGDPHWVPPLRSDVAKQFQPSNPFFHYGHMRQAIAVDATGAAVGRVVAAVNKRLVEREGRSVGVVGFFECINSLDIAGQLLDDACAWLKGQGMELARGPIDFSTHNSCLFLADGFDLQPHVMTPYNPAYYPVFFEQLGWKKAKDAYAYNLPLDRPLDSIYERGYRVATKAGITFRPLNTKGDGFLADCRAFYRLFTRAFVNNWSSSERSEAEFLEEAQSLRSLVDPDIFWIAEDDGEMVGLFLALPDYNIPLKHVGGRLNAIGILKFLWFRRQIDRGRVLAIASLPEYRRKMVPLALIHLGMTGATQKRRPYRSAELSWVYEDNWPSRKVIEATGAQIYKTYRMYEKLL